jgi:predicted ATPase
VCGLLERDDELDIIQAAVTALWLEHRGNLLAVTGAAGLGKTTLLAAVQEAAHAAGLLVLTARGNEREQGSAFHVVRGLLEPLLGQVRGAERRELLGAWHDIVGATVGLAACGAAPDPQSALDGLHSVVTNLVFARGPLVLIVDDAHWGDAESLSWMTAFAERIANLPILLAVAYRPDEMQERTDVLRGFSGASEPLVLRLSPLTPEAVEALVRRLYSSTADAPSTTVEDAFCREVWAVTGGNPFETVELVAKASERGISPVEASWHDLRSLVASVSGPNSRVRQLGRGPSRLTRAVAASVTRHHSQMSPASAR